MDIETFIGALMPVIAQCKEYDESDGKFLLWITVIATSIPEDQILGLAHQQGFFAHGCIRHLTCLHGTVVYSVCDGYVRLNLLIARAKASDGLLRAHAQTAINGEYPGYIIDANPLATHTDEVRIPTKTRRFMYNPRVQVPKLSLRANTLLDGVAHAVKISAVLKSAHDVGAFTPLFMAHSDDPLNQVYWVRVACGTIVTLKNPRIPWPDTFVVPACEASNDMILYLRRTFQAVEVVDVLETLVRPSLSLVVLQITNVHIPMRLRYMIMQGAVNHMGLQDELLMSMLQLHESQRYTRLMNEMWDMAYIIGMLYKVPHGAQVPSPSEGYVCDVLNRTLLGVDNVELWTRWVHHSEFMRTVVEKVTSSGLRKLCHKLKSAQALAARVLGASIGKWANEDVAKARALAQMGVASEAMAAEIRRLEDQARDAAVEMIEEEDTQVKGRRQHARKQRALSSPPCVKAGANECEDAAVKAKEAGDEQTVRVHDASTHHDLATRLAAFTGLDCELIGSGVFDNTGDVDIVVTCSEATSLEAAYDAVIRCTGWTPAYFYVTGKAVAVLHGTFEGVPVDAQVWRGADHVETQAERLTMHAVGLARRMETQLGDFGKGDVRRLHAWFCAASVKGHINCCMPGIAVTCAAVVLRARAGGGDCLPSMLSELRCVLSATSPCIDFDSIWAAPASNAPPCSRSAMRVLENEVNLSSRMTRATTRHLFETVLHALALDTRCVLTADTYRAWRKRRMIQAVRAAPHTCACVATMLYSTVRSLDGHPMIDELYIDDAEEGSLHVLVTLCCDASVDNYGFRDDDVVTLNAAQPLVKRRHRSWVMCHAPLGAGRLVSWEERTSVTDVVQVSDDVYVPNAPSLAVDVAACFDKRAWMIEVS